MRRRHDHFHSSSIVIRIRLQQSFSATTTREKCAPPGWWTHDHFHLYRAVELANDCWRSFLVVARDKWAMSQYVRQGSGDRCAEGGRGAGAVGRTRPVEQKAGQ